MKQDPYFKYLAVFILAGVILAFVNPTPEAARPSKIPAVAAATTPSHGAKS